MIGKVFYRYAAMCQWFACAVILYLVNYLSNLLFYTL